MVESVEDEDEDPAAGGEDEGEVASAPSDMSHGKGTNIEEKKGQGIPAVDLHGVEVEH